MSYLSELADSDPEARSQLTDLSVSNREIGRRLDVDEKNVRRWRARNLASPQSVSSPRPKYKNGTAQWVPGMDLGTDDGEVRTVPRWVGDGLVESGDADLMREVGVDPEEWEIIARRESRWQQAEGGPFLRAYRLSVRRCSRRTGDLPVEVMNEILRQDYTSRVPAFDTARFDWDSRVFVIPVGDLQVGKALADDTPMFTPSGWTTHGEIRSGDYVFGPDGEPKMVLAVTGTTEQDIFEVVFDKDTVIRATGDHLWSGYRKYRVKDLRDVNGVRRYTGHQARRDLIWTTAQIAALPRHKRTRSEDLATTRAFHVDLTKPLQFPESESDFPVDPYLLGAWLGDGFSRTGMICGAPEDLKIMLQDYTYAVVPSMTRDNCMSVRFKGLTRELRDLGVIENKHIPDEYLRGTAGQRLALLQGLMDTDGFAEKRGSVEFTSVIRDLAESVQFLVSSLGMKAKISEKVATLDGIEKQRAYRVTFSPHLPVFTLPRKLERQRDYAEGHQTRFRFVQEVRPAGRALAQCLTVEGGLYLAGKDLVVTHNCDGGGTEALIERFAELTAMAKQRLQVAGGVKRLVLPWLGDCIEGIVSQGGRLATRLDVSVTEQVRIYRRLMLHQIATLAPEAEYVIVPVVPGNHDESTRQFATTPTDSWAIEGASAVQDALAMSGKYSHVSFLFPQHENLVASLNVGTDERPFILAFAHGHQPGSPSKSLDWWKDQGWGRRHGGNGDLLLTGHFHHLRVEATGGGRTWVQIPALDGGSNWFRESKGADEPAGMVSMWVTPGVGNGWEGLTTHS